MADKRVWRALLYPERIALIGASSTEGRLTARPQSFLRAHGFSGTVYPVNPLRETVLGEAAYASVADTPEPVDHAYILLDAEPALAALEACGKAGVKVVSMLADGFAEIGGEGIKRQQRLQAIAQEYGLTVIGPNSMGVVENSRGFVCTTNAAFATKNLPTGNYAVLSQSGSMIGAILSRGAALGIGFKSYISVGNEACLGVGELGQLLVDDPAIDGFVLFLETIRRPEQVAAFADMARALGKPIIAYMVGRSDAGQSLAASHTGAMTGGAKAMMAFLDGVGITRVDGFEALIEMTNAAQVFPRLHKRPKQVTVLTTTGGGGGMVYDQLGLNGVPLTGMSDSTRHKLEKDGLVIKQGPLVDVTLAGANYDTMKAVVSALINDTESGLIVAAIGSSAQFHPELAVKPILDAVHEAGPDAAPVLAFPIPHAPESLHLFNAGGVPAFRTVESAAEVVAALLSEPSPQAGTVDDLPACAVTRLDSAEAGAMTEIEASDLFSDLGLVSPSAIVLKPDETLPTELPFAGPYALKVVSRDIQHKSQVGGVTINLASRNAIADALVSMKDSVKAAKPNAPIEGYLVQKMQTGLGEAIIGLSRDATVGPIITVGLGGVMTEIYQDIALRPAPVGTEAARAMIDEVKGFAVLRGYRNAPKGDVDALANAVSQVSKLALCDRVLEAEINPVLVREKGKGVMLLDALVQLRSDE